MAERSIGIEILPSRANMVEMDPAADPPKVLRFSSIALLSPDAENSSQQLLAAWPHIGFRTRNARIALSPSGESGTHHLLSLPPMPKKEMAVVVAREMQETLKVPLEEMFFDFDASEAGEGIGDVLVAAAPIRLVNEGLQFLEHLRLTPELITTFPLALFNSVRLVEGIGKGIVAHIHVGESQVHILILKGGRWAFHRQFPSLPTKEEVSTEVHRTFLYFRQKFQGVEISKVLLTGSGTEGQENEWEEALGVKIEPFLPVLDLAPLKGRAQEFAQLLPEFVVPLGLAGVRAQETVNLIGSRVVRARQGEVLRKAVIGAVAASILLMGGSYSWLTKDVSRMSKTVEAKKGELKRLEPYLAAQRERALYAENKALFQTFGHHLRFTELLKEFSVLVPAELAFQSLGFKREGEKVKMTLKGEVSARTAVETQEVFNRFYTQLTSSPFLSQVNVDPGSLKVNQPVPGDKDGFFRLEFEVKGELKPIEIQYDNI